MKELTPAVSVCTFLELSIDTPSQDQPDFDSISLLIPRFRDGDLDARELLMSELASYLEIAARKNLHGNLKQKLGTSDVVQMAFLRIVENFEQFKGETKAEFLQWIRTIVANEINVAWRSYSAQKRNLNLEQPITSAAATADPARTPSSRNIARERIAMFREVLNELSPDYAQVIELRSIDQLSFREIGERMDRSEDAVNKLWFRAMQKLEEKIKNHSSFESQ